MVQESVPGDIKVLCLSAVRNEEKFLPGFFDHLRDFVTGFVILDDGSVDDTSQIIRDEPKLLSVITNPVRDKNEIYDEKKVKISLLEEARRLGADAVFCCDADERYELAFLQAMDALARKAIRHNFCLGLKFRELWDRPDTFRHDGIWGNKKKYLLFPLADEMTFDQTMRTKIHLPWHYDALARRLLPTKYNAYHLKMVFNEEREARKALYEKHDPNHECQSIGYQYLTEMEGLQLARIDSSQAYDYATLPEEYRALLRD